MADTGSIPTTLPRRPALGMALIALSAVSYGLTPVVARQAYGYGSTPLTLLSLRYLSVTLVLALGLAMARRRLALPPPRRFAGIGVGVLFSIMSYGYLASVRYIPVSLAALVFYTFPIIVALIGRWRGEAIGPAKAMALLAAFGGLALGLGVSFEALDPRGVALSLLALAGYIAMLFYSARAVQGVDPVVVNLHAMATASAVFLPLTLATGSWAVPEGIAAWLCIAANVAAFLVGVVAFFAGIGMLGAVRTAMLSNIEPLVAILGAVLFLGETLSLPQSLGVALLMAALVVLGR